MPTADELLGADEVMALAECLVEAGGPAAADAVRECLTVLPGLSLRQRSDRVADALVSGLSGDFAALEKVTRTALSDPRFTGWMIWPVTEAAVVTALRASEGAAFEEALSLLADLTPRLTAEFALRKLLRADLNRTLAVVTQWTAHPDEHVRRLASEGTRPRLPWAVRVPAILDDPAATLPILTALYRDPSEYVRRSVSNHLNDISHAEPALAVDIATRWAPEVEPSTSRLIRHGLRTLIKRGDPNALALLGYEPALTLTVEGPVLDEAVVAVGGQLNFGYSLENYGNKPARLVVDYIIHYRKANGSTSAKVFKLTTLTLSPGQKLSLRGSRPFKPLSTRALHLGKHFVELQVNGHAQGKAAFDLVVARSRTPSL